MIKEDATLLEGDRSFVLPGEEALHVNRESNGESDPVIILRPHSESIRGVNHRGIRELLQPARVVKEVHAVHLGTHLP